MPDGRRQKPPLYVVGWKKGVPFKGRTWVRLSALMVDNGQKARPYLTMDKAFDKGAFTVLLVPK